MTDESIRGLERALAGSPGSARLRLQLARALVRAGSPREALGRLDIATIDAGFYREARALADELWLDELARLERRASIPAGRGPHHGETALATTETGLAGWGSDWNAGGGFAVADLETATLIHADPQHRSRQVLAARDRVFSEERPLQGGVRVVAVDRRSVHAVDLEAGSQVVGVSPEGDRIAVFREGMIRIHAWPAFTLLLERQGWAPLVDWDANVLHVIDEKAQRFVVPLDGSERQPFEGARTDFSLHRLGAGVYAATGYGLRLSTWPGRKTIPLVPASREHISPPSLSSDRRSVRIVFGAKPRRFEVDLEAGEVVAAPPDVARLARVNPETGRWHPHVDALWRYRKDRLMELLTPERRGVLVLPSGVWPLAWVPDGHALLAVSSREDGSRVLEVWRTGEAPRA